MNAEPASAPEAAESGANTHIEIRFSGRRDEQFEAFVADAGPYLLRVALLLSGDPGHAEDLVQATFERHPRRCGPTSNGRTSAATGGSTAPTTTDWPR